MNQRLQETETAVHPAIEAWMTLRGGQAAPHTAIEILQKRRKGLVYRLRGAGPDRTDVVAKWSSRERIEREALAYERVLPRLGIPTVRYYGTTTEPDARRAWAFMADAGGQQYSALSSGHRVLAARWLGLLHSSAADNAPDAALPDRGPSYYLGELWSALDEIGRHRSNPALARSDVRLLDALVGQCQTVAANWKQVERLCALTPPTFIHGDFAPKNMRVERIRGLTMLRPFDWASSGWGTPATDLAQADESPGAYWASPNLDAYVSTVASSWPRIERRDAFRLAVVGKVLRTLICVRLEAVGLATDWPVAAMGDMRYYEADLEQALGTLGWEQTGN